ncbi:MULTISPECIES: SDR family NAD(P)-dependent oxidoreductase [unclassified Roseitalea]|uniref:SDR family NAD(P)-dependent oxidoreductase n=1 Tax=unclassified Roseitalea TaxID=2639107 RepID=UPI00273FA0E3|nr:MULTISPECIES: SDR family NAD(P)-dependent oxidoreductase [unclassified Roseitalea]
MDATVSGSGYGIAVVGIGCRFPGGAESPGSFWRFLNEKGRGIREIPEDRWSLTAAFDPDPSAIGKSTSKWGGFLDDVRSFDPGFFDISPREAASMDPQQRLLLQATYEALQDAGTTIAEAQNARTGVFVGISTSDYGLNLRMRRSSDEIWAGTGSAYSIAANRVSHRFDFTGPSVAVDTACSSSLVSVDLACRSILDGACDAAVAAGVNIMLSPDTFVVFSKANMLSLTGEISSFDARANGFVRGEGVGAVLLKPLDKALADGDRIYAIVRATNVNQDGRTSTLTAPNFESQMQMLKGLCRRASVDPVDVGFIEAHGTGTPIGDPIEAKAIGRVFGTGRPGGPALVGTVKPNVGHLESGAGICGFIKAALTVYHGTVPPNRNFDTPNPAIPMDALNIAVPVATTELPSHDGATRFAAVNAFGFGGTNASALLENWSGGDRGNARARLTPGAVLARHDFGPILVPLSASSEPQLRQVAADLSAALVDDGSLAAEPIASLASTLALHRDQFAERAVVLASDRQHLRRSLDMIAAGEEQATEDRYAIPPFVSGRARASGKLAVTFAGQGGQWWGMARRLLTCDQVYRQSVDEFDALFRNVSGWSVVDAMLSNEASSRIDDADVTQPAIFANQIGLMALWRKWGIEPDLLIGHSFGEVAAAYIADAISLSTAARLIHARGMIRDAIGSVGAMAAVGLSVDELAAFLPDDGSVVVAAYNGPALQTVSGEIDGVERLLAAVEAQFPNALVRRLKMDFGWHGPQLDSGEVWFRKTLGEIEWSTPNLPVVSTVTGRLETRFDTDYWWRNLREPVAFDQAMRFALASGADTFLEMGPHRTLAPLTAGIVNDAGINAAIVHSLHREQDDYDALAVAKAILHTHGTSLDWRKINSGPGRRDLALPLYPWAREELWNSPEEARRTLFSAEVHPLLGRRAGRAAPAWTNEITLKAFGYINDHRVEESAVFPAAGYIEMMVAAARDHFGAGPVELRNVRFLDALSIGNDDWVMLETTLDIERGIVRIYSRTRDYEEDWRLRADAYVLRRPLEAERVDAAAMVERREPSIGKSDFYRLTALHGLNYGALFQGIDAAWCDGDRCVAKVSAPHGVDLSAQRYIAHPALLDACFQAPIPLIDIDAGVWDPSRSIPETDEEGHFPLMLPIGIERLAVVDQLPHQMWVDFRTVPVNGSSTEMGGVYRITGPDGQVLVTIDNFRMKQLAAHQSSTAASVKPVFHVESLDLLSETAGAELHDGKSETAVIDWLVLDDGSGPGAALAEALRSCGATAMTVSGAPIADSGPDRLAEAFADFLDDDLRPAGIVDLRSLAFDEQVSAHNLVEAAERNVLNLADAGRALDQLREIGKSRPYWIITNGARVAADSDALTEAGLSQSGVVGLARTLSAEIPEFNIRLADVDRAAVSAPVTLARLLIANGEETEIVLRGGDIHVSRVQQMETADLPPRMRRIDLSACDDNFVVTMTRPGSVDNIVLREAETPQPGPDELLIEVMAVGLNFRDIMVATGILPDEIEGDGAWWRNMGFEYSGRVKAVGSGVTKYRPGDRIMGMGKGFLRRYAITKQEAVVGIANDVSYADAASFPVGFMTACYALEELGRLSEGETALIHTATGGVGLAAIQVARNIGANVFATAGTPEKRQYLNEMGIAFVGDSRSVDFADGVRKATGGRGVDLVLNALAGSAIDKGLECLAPFGRFIEIGKRDLFADKPIGLKSLYYNNSFHVVDLSVFEDERPGLITQLLETVSERLGDGSYQPLPQAVFPVSDVVEAFRHMAKAQHIGKVVITFDDAHVDVQTDMRKPAPLDAEAGYLITGGLSGFGLAVAEWMAANGAGRIVLAGRKGAVRSKDAARVEAMRAQGAEIVPLALDATDARAVDAAIGDLVAHDKPLRGIVHGAMVLQDGFIGQLTDDQFTAVLRPKIKGAWNMHRALEARGAGLDFFVCFSSLAQMIGSQGQSNYVAANAFLDAFASYRRAGGRAAQTIDWGALGESGFVARSDAMASYLDSVGMKPIGDDIACEALGQFIMSALPTAAFAKVDWQSITRGSPGANAPRMRGLLAGAGRGGTKIRTQLAATDKSQWPALLSEFIQGEIARVLKVEAASVPLDRALAEVGLDSLSSFELKNRVEAELDIAIPVGKFLQAPTVGGLSDVIVRAIEADTARTEQAGLSASPQSKGDGAAPDAFPVMPRQLAAIAVDKGLMSSEMARHAQWFRATLTMDQGVAMSAVGAALEALAREQPALRLRLGQGSEATFELSQEPPALVPLGEPGPDETLSGQSGALWRFGWRSRDDGAEVHIACHTAAGDRWSVQFVSQRLKELAEGQTEQPPADYCAIASDCVVDDNEASLRDQAFWQEVLHDLPQPIVFTSRSRATAPVGMGWNAGSIVTLSTRIASWTSADDPIVSEGRLLSAMAGALECRFGEHRMIVERTDLVRREPDRQDVVGPFADALPILVERHAGHEWDSDAISRRLRTCLHHRRFDAAACAALLADRFDKAGLNPAQIGFAFIDHATVADLDPDMLDAIFDDAATRAVNEIRLTAVERDGALELLWAFDADVVDEETASGLLETIAETLGEAIAIKRFDPKERAVGRHQSGIRAASSKARRPTVPKSNGRQESLPVTAQQLACLNIGPDNRNGNSLNAYWVSMRALRIRPGLDVDRLRRAVAQVVGRHQSLRMRFVRLEGDWRVTIPADAPDAFAVRDLGAVSASALEEQLSELGRTDVDFESGPLFRVTLLRCGSDGDVFHLWSHHVVHDAYCLAIVMNELFAAYMGMPIGPKPEMTFERYLREVERVGDVGATQAAQAHYSATLLPPLTPPRIGWAASGDQFDSERLNFGRSGNLDIETSDRADRELDERLRRAGVTETALQIAAFASVICRRGGADGIYVNCEMAGRTTPALESYVGYVANMTMLRCDFSAYHDLEAVARDIGKQLRAAAAMGAPGNFTRQRALAEQLRADGAYLPQFEVSQTFPKSVMARSPLAPVMFAAPGARASFGGLMVEPLHHPTLVDVTRYEYQWRSLHTGKSRMFRSMWDPSAYGVGEALQFAVESLQEMGVEPPELKVGATYEPQESEKSLTHGTATMMEHHE